MTKGEIILILKGEIRRYRSMASLCDMFQDKTLAQDYRMVEEALCEALAAFEMEVDYLS